jgi:hypothetical protein
MAHSAFTSGGPARAGCLPRGFPATCVKAIQFSNWVHPRLYGHGIVLVIGKSVSVPAAAISYLNLVPKSHLQRRVTRLRAPPPNRLSALQGGSRFKKPTSNTHPLHLARCSRFFLAGSFLPGPYGEDRLRGAAFRSVGDCSSERRFRADFEPFIDLLSSRKYHWDVH